MHTVIERRGASRLYPCQGIFRKAAPIVSRSSIRVRALGSHVTEAHCNVSVRRIPSLWESCDLGHGRLISVLGYGGWGHFEYLRIRFGGWG